ncbi:MAG TPA: hypothetical protein PK530_09365 [Anaerolineales bacterium]|nr:hypothetical protein [Anaerolineales bacterium]
MKPLRGIVVPLIGSLLILALEIYGYHWSLEFKKEYQLLNFQAAALPAFWNLMLHFLSGMILSFILPVLPDQTQSKWTILVLLLIPLTSIFLKFTLFFAPSFLLRMLRYPLWVQWITTNSISGWWVGIITGWIFKRPKLEQI